jgi:hypothetical protein
MSKISGGNLFKEPAKWPLIPPWWLLSSPQAAALLNVTSATLHNWRVRGEGVTPIPPMFLKPTQGDPIYYQYGAVRSWAAERIGISYSMDDQCSDFLSRTEPRLKNGSGSWQDRANTFNMLFRESHKGARKGEKTTSLPLDLVRVMDVYYSRQPLQLQPTF